MGQFEYQQSGVEDLFKQCNGDDSDILTFSHYVNPKFTGDDGPKNPNFSFYRNILSMLFKPGRTGSTEY